MDNKDNKEVMIKTSVNIEIPKDDRLYRFVIPVGAPFGETADVLFEALKVVDGWREQAKKKALELEEEKKKNDPVIEEKKESE